MRNDWKAGIIAEHKADAFSLACQQLASLADKLASESEGKFTSKNLFEELLSSLEYNEDANANE